MSGSIAHEAPQRALDIRPRPARSRALRWDSPALMSPGGILSGTAALGLPLLLSLAGMASLNRLAYPALALVVGGFLYVKRSPWYVGYCVWLFCACSLIRRLADHQAGFQISSTILLAPYVACLFSAASAFRYLGTGRNPRSIPIILVLATIFYGTVLAVLQGRLTLGLVDALKWSAGPLIAVHVLAAGRDASAAQRRAIATALIAAAPLMALYGIMQFANPFPWDADWVINVRQIGFNSIGVPEPFGLRVFGPMHSPGSLAAYLMLGLLLSTAQRAYVSWLLVAICSLCLALCMYRTLWAATCLGMLLIALWGTSRAQMKILVGAALVLVGASALAMVPEVEHMLTRRFSSLTELEADASGAVRLMQYLRFFVDGRDHLQGLGLGINYQASVGGQGAALLDSGILDILRSLGLFGGVLYLSALGALLLAVLRRPAGPGMNAVIFRAAAIACFIQLPLGSIQAAEAGFLGWLVLAAALSASLRQRGAGLHRAPTLRRAPIVVHSQEEFGNDARPA